ncbi:hypothetical protein H5410_042634 [Solanum commersonii]|uniref:F-box associated beta-propeller type 1 domain-containing protein n=1 Tax=Solanum commersonii TaxID=4109 RepID=A0A9J5XY17_SOLCO|nr:hypothetical protein H5410_042634 [Solanum commersonii]
MYVLGFGFDLLETGDHKLVRLVYYMNGAFKYNVPPEVEIYSIKTGVWRSVMGVEIKHYMMEFWWSRDFVNGVVHWIAYDVVPNGGGNRNLVTSFSIVDEVFGEIMFSDALFGVISTNLSIKKFEESLAVVKYVSEISGASCECEVWVMRQYGVLESWSRLYRINLVTTMMKVVGFRNNGAVLFSTRSNDLLSYNPNNEQNRGLGIQGSSHPFYVQMESLILFKRNNVVSGGFLEGM